MDRAANGKLTKRAQALAQKFNDDCQALFDDEAMTDELYGSEVMEMLVLAQSAAEDVGNV